MGANNIPIYITFRYLADTLRYSYPRARNWAIRANCVVRRAGCPVVSLEKLKEAFPEVYDRIMQEQFERDEFDHIE